MLSPVRRELCAISARWTRRLRCASKRMCARMRLIFTVLPTPMEQDWFRLLTTVQGVGAKVALAILGSLSPEQLAQAIMAQDKAALTSGRRRRAETGFASGHGTQRQSARLHECTDALGLSHRCGPFALAAQPRGRRAVGSDKSRLSPRRSLCCRRRSQPTQSRIQTRRTHSLEPRGTQPEG